MKQYFLLSGIACALVYTSASTQTFIKPRTTKQFGVSTASLQEDCGSLLADILQISQHCLQQLLTVSSHTLLGLQVNITQTVRNLIYDTDSCLSGLSKSA